MQGFELTLAFDQALPKGVEWGRALHGLFFKKILKTKTADLLRSSLSFKPYTLRYKSVSQGAQMKLRVNLLLEGFKDTLAEELPQKVGYKFNLDSWDGHIAFVNSFPFPTYSDILLGANSSEYFSLSFRKTTFKRGDYDYPLPDPILIFGNLCTRWHSFSPIKMSEDLPTIWEKSRLLILDSSRVSTIVIGLNQEEIHAFNGTVIFRIAERNKVLRQQIHALARYATIAGIGAKTTMGLGMARYEPIFAGAGGKTTHGMGMTRRVVGEKSR
jgi:CRISPR-associated endoribonuclease Cas6